MGYFAENSKTYKEVAQKAGLDEKTTERYLSYMMARWANSEEEKCFVGYAGEWALRFKDGREYETSDLIGLSILEKMKDDEKWKA